MRLKNVLMEWTGSLNLEEQTIFYIDSQWGRKMASGTVLMAGQMGTKKQLSVARP